VTETSPASRPLPDCPRQVAFQTLRDIDRSSAYTDRALDRHLEKSSLNSLDKSLTTEIVYGIERRRRTLDALIDRLGKVPSDRQPPDLRRILHVGLYQLRYLSSVPPSAAVNTTVELTKKNNLGRLSSVVNGILRQYLRLSEGESDPLPLPNDPLLRLGVLYSFPDWIIRLWWERWGIEETEQLCQWFDRSPDLDIRVNPLKTTREAVEKELTEARMQISPLEDLPLALRLSGGTRGIDRLTGFRAGHYIVQDASAQMVTLLLDPKPGETIIDACAAPGGKTTHIAELMGDSGRILACDQTESRLRPLRENIRRSGFTAIEVHTADSRQRPEWQGIADRVLLDVPCSGLGTLHKRPDIRWRQTAENLPELAKLQGELLTSAASWVKPKGILVYSTCTLDPLENGEVIETFLDRHPEWQIQPPIADSLFTPFLSGPGWLEVLPHRHDRDGFFLVRLVKKA
jgi:16S rRNA (cytosine967-C5)-methyltransferase